MERVKKPIPEGETIGQVKGCCLAGNPDGETRLLATRGNWTPDPADGQRLPSFLSAWSWPVSSVSIPQGRPTPVALFVLLGTPIWHSTGLRALPN